MIRIFRHYISGTYLVVFLMELCVFSAAFYLGDLLRDFNRNLIFFISDGIWLPSMVFCAVMLISSAGMGLYQRRTHHFSDIAILLRISASFLLGWVLISLLFFLFPALYVWHRIIAYALSVSMTGMLISRFFFLKYADNQSLMRRILVLGADYVVITA